MIPIFPPFSYVLDPPKAEADTEDEGPPDPPKCPDCKGEGKIELFTGLVDCETCDGSGY